MAGQAITENTAEKSAWQSRHLCSKSVALSGALSRQRLAGYRQQCSRASDRAFVIGRKNWLFAQSVNGANASAVLYSLVETAKANGLEPYAWLRYVLSKFPQLTKGASVEHLLPMNLTPDDLKIADWWA